MQNLEMAWRVIQRNGQHSNSESVRNEIARFAEDPYKKLRSMQFRLSRGKFLFEPARGIPIPKLDNKGKPTGKHRPIVLASLEARIVQRALLNVLVEIPGLVPFVNTPHSFGGLRKVKATTPAIVAEDKRTISAVPAAIDAILREISEGARYVACADISAFFTRISKASVRKIISDAVQDDELMAFFDEVIKVELSNLAALRELADLFPKEDIGVAQGNSLSPLLGNIILYEFDKILNEGDCSCIRYIDDFVILAPTEKAANARLRKAIELLDAHGMSLAQEKSSKRGVSIENGFEFLGISIVPGLIRPTAKKQEKFLASLDKIISESERAITGLRHGNEIDPKHSLISTLKRLDGSIGGWGKHYWFCNDVASFRAIDDKIRKKVKDYLGMYTSVRAELTPERQHLPLGMISIAHLVRQPFIYPKATQPESTVKK
jgi:retron-type reverse transcriptase